MAPFGNRTDEVAAAIRKGDITRSLKLLRGIPRGEEEIINELLAGGLGLLHVSAAEKKSLEVLMELIIMGADVNILSACGNRPLHFAAMHNSAAVVEILLRCGADASLPNAQGLLAAELTELASIHHLLLRDRKIGTPSVVEIRHQMAVHSTAMQQATLDTSVPPRPVAPEITESAEDSEVAAQVLEAARRTAKSYRASNHENSNMQMIAKCCSSNNEKLLAALQKKLQAEPSLLLSRTSGLLQLAPDGFTPLHVAAASNNVAAIQLMLGNTDVKLSPWVRDLQGRTPLHIAAAERKDEACRVLRAAMLLERPGQDPIGPTAPVDLTGTTPLGWAVFKADKRPPIALETMLFSPGDRSVLPATPKFGREGSSVRTGRRAVADSTGLPATLGEIKFGFGEAGGWRPAMEDRVFVRCPVSGELPFCSAFGVMDGHGGDFSSSFLSEVLPAAIEEALLVHAEESRNSSWTDVILRSSLLKAFAVAETNLRSQPRMQVEVTDKKKIVPVIDKSGSTAITCCFTPLLIACANVGDSRAVLAKWRDAGSPQGDAAQLDAYPLSFDHKPTLLQERARIEAAGASVICVVEDKVYEVSAAGTDLKLRMSRSFGDFYLKQVEGLRPEQQPISAEPEIMVVQRSSLDAFVILACDGVWDVMSSQEAVDFVGKQLYKGGGASKSIAEVCDALLLRCLELGTTDNMTAMIVQLSSGVGSSGDARGTAFDTPIGNVMSAASIGSAMRSGDEASPPNITAASGSCKKNLILEFDE